MTHIQIFLQHPFSSYTIPQWLSSTRLHISSQSWLLLTPVQRWLNMEWRHNWGINWWVPSLFSPIKFTFASQMTIAHPPMRGEDQHCYWCGKTSQCYTRHPSMRIHRGWLQVILEVNQGTLMTQHYSAFVCLLPPKTAPWHGLWTKQWPSSHQPTVMLRSSCFQQVLRGFSKKIK